MPVIQMLFCKVMVRIHKTERSMWAGGLDEGWAKTVEKSELHLAGQQGDRVLQADTGGHIKIQNQDTRNRKEH